MRIISSNPIRSYELRITNWSLRDYELRMYISLKESNETLYWLRLLYRTRYITEKQFKSVYADCEELKRILMSATKKARENIKPIQN